MSKKKPKSKSDPAAAPAYAQELNRAFASAAPAEISQALVPFIAAHTSRWKALFARMESIRDPAHPRTHLTDVLARCDALGEAAAELAKAGRIAPADRVWLDSFASTYGTCALRLEKIRRRLKSSQMFDDSLATQTFRLGILIEHQSILGLEKATGAGSAGGYDYHALIADSLKNPDGTGTSILHVAEETVECVELILRYSHFAASPNTRDGNLDPKHPFGDPELEVVLNLANLWRWLEELGGLVRFAQWISVHNSDDDSDAIVPSGPTEAQLRRVGEIREQHVLAEFLAGGLLDESSDAPEVLNALASKIRVPAAGCVWDGAMPLDEFAQACDHTSFRGIAEAWVEFRHYEPLLKRVRFADTAVQWTDWLTATERLKVLAAVLSNAAQRVEGSRPRADWRRRVFVCKQKDLVDVLRAKGGLTKACAEECLALLTFNRDRRSLELWDQPLLPLSADRVLIVPSLVMAGNPARALENFITQWSPDDFDSRGTPFEVRVREDIASLCPGEVQSSVKYDGSDGRGVEHDVIWWWGGYLFFIETKCVKSVHSSADWLRAKSVVEEALEQLRRRRALSKTDWQSLRSAASGLSLPAQHPGDDHVFCVALLNVLPFTSLVTDEAVVTDDICLRRYFGHPEIEAFRSGKNGLERLAVVGRVRDGDPTPAAFMHYLQDPPQCTSVKSDLVKALFRVPVFDEDDSRVAQLTWEYHPTNPLKSA